MFSSGEAKERQLILQVYPRGDPSRAVVYHGDQEFIRQVLSQVARRLEEDLAGRAEGDLELLGEGEDGG